MSYQEISRRQFLKEAILIPTALIVVACGRQRPTTRDTGISDSSAEYEESNLRGNIMAAGSSTVYPITATVAEEFRKRNRQVQTAIGISGTGGGFNRFCNGEADINNASRLIAELEKKACANNGINYIEFPIAIDGIAALVHPHNSWVDVLTFEELKTIWEPVAQGKILYWDQVRPGWPHVRLRLYGPGTDSGTFDFFTERVTGKEKHSRGDFMASENDNVVIQGVAGDVNSLGYLGYSYYTENQDKVKAVPIIAGGSTQAISPTLENIIDGSYPLSRPLFIYVRRSALSEKPALQEFLKFYFTEGPKLIPSREVGAIPLPPETYAENLRILNNEINRVAST